MCAAIADDTTVSVMIHWTIRNYFAFVKPCIEFQELTKLEVGVKYFGFSLDESKAVYREGYVSAEACLTHLDHTRAAFQAAQQAADIDKIEIHGPKSQVDKLRDFFKSFPVSFWSYVDGAFFVPDKYHSVADHIVPDSTLSVHVYWEIADALAFLSAAVDFQALTREEEEVRFYGFALCGEQAVCREGYDSAQGFLSHLRNVDAALQAAQRAARISKIEVHGPIAEVETLRSPLRDFPVVYWGYPAGAFLVPTQCVGSQMALEDPVVTLCPYFRLNDCKKFKQIWQQDFRNFAHKSDCVHYSFGFTTDGRAHCREAYKNAEAVLQHLADVDTPLKAVLNGPAELERLEVHGPKAEIDKLVEPLTPFNCKFFVSEWGFRPHKPAMGFDTVCHLYPYFKLNRPDEFKKIWRDAYPATKAAAEAEKSHQYSFSFENRDVASCREAYADADGILLHLRNVDAPLKAVLNGPADLLRLEVHGPKAECDKLQEALGPLGCTFFHTEWGFRNAFPLA